MPVLNIYLCIKYGTIETVTLIQGRRIAHQPNIQMRKIQNHLRLAMTLTSPSTSIQLIPIKVTKATQADLNVSSIQY